MDNRQFIMAVWKEFNPDATKSMRDDFQNERLPEQEKIVEYLNHGKITVTAASYDKDVFTGGFIGDTHCIRTDGEYSWLGSLGYYVENYHVKLPEAFVDKILST